VAVDLLTVLEEHGVLLQAAKGPVTNVAELVAGEPIRGSWWAHPAHDEIFARLNELADHPDVVRLRLVDGKVTLVHRRLWPVLVRLADRFAPERLAALDEEHTADGRHRVDERPFPDWVPAEDITSGEAMALEDAEAQLPGCLR
jgi:hypothetical protein